MVVGVGSMQRAGSGSQAGGAALGRERSAVERRRARSTSCSPCARRRARSALAQALDPRAAGRRAHRDRLGDVAPAVALADVGRRQLAVASNASSVGRRSPARRARRARVRAARAAKKPARAAASGSSWIVCIGTAISVERRSPRSNARGVGDDHRRTSSPRRAARSAERREQLGVEVERRHRAPGAGEVAARRGRCPRRRRARRPPARQLPPQRQVGGVGAALDVVPDRRAHRQYSSRVAAAGEQVAQLEQRRVGRERVQRPVARRRARGRARARARRRPRAASASTPAYFRRSASSAARVPGAGHPAHVRREHLPVGVPHPRDVAAVGGAVVEHAEQVELARPRARACAAPRWRRRGS